MKHGRPNTYKSEIVGAANNWPVGWRSNWNPLCTNRICSSLILLVPKGRKVTFIANLILLWCPIRKTSCIINFTHHDLWDRDPSAHRPTCNNSREGKRFCACPSNQKQANVVLFDSGTGPHVRYWKRSPYPPLLGCERKHGKTQPFPTKPDLLQDSPNLLTEKTKCRMPKQGRNYSTQFQWTDKSQSNAPSG